jgi:5-methylcytosine-specific restriction endonuclease McrA
MTDLPAWPKPHQLEGHEHLSPKEKRKVLRQLFHEQGGICGCGCNRSMMLLSDYFESATLDHIKPQPMGHAKNDARSNLRAVRWDCNGKKGSRRDYDGSRG